VPEWIPLQRLSKNAQSMLAVESSQLYGDDKSSGSSEQLDRGPSVIAIRHAANNSMVRCGLARHFVTADMARQNCLEGGIKLPIPASIVQLSRQAVQVLAHFEQSALHVLQALPHYVLKLDMAHRLR